MWWLPFPLSLIAAWWADRQRTGSPELSREQVLDVLVPAALSPELQAALGGIFSDFSNVHYVTVQVLRPWFPARYAEEAADQIAEDILNSDPWGDQMPSWLRWPDRYVDPRGIPHLMRGSRRQDLAALEISLDALWNALEIPVGTWREDATAYLIEGFWYKDSLPRWMTHSEWGEEVARVAFLLADTQGLPELLALDVASLMPLEDLQVVQTPAQAAQVVRNNRGLLEAAAAELKPGGRPELS